MNNLKILYGEDKSLNNEIANSQKESKVNRLRGEEVEILHLSAYHSFHLQPYSNIVNVFKT